MPGPGRADRDPSPARSRRPRRPGRLRGRLAGDAARRRLLGHRRAPGGRPVDGHRPPDRLSDLRPGRLARIGRPPAIRGTGVPDEPAVGDLPGRRGRGHGRPGPDADRTDRARDRRRPGDGLDPDRLGDRHPRRGTCPPPGARGDPPVAPRRLGRPRSAPGPCRAARSRRSLSARRDARLRAGRRQSLADPPAGHPDRALRPGGRSPDLATRAARPVVHRACSR